MSHGVATKEQLLPKKSSAEKVLSLHKWARYKVLAYEATLEDLYRMVASQIDPPRESDTDEEFEDLVTLSALLMFRARAKISPQYFSIGLRDGIKPAFLLSFCSTILLPGGWDFYVDNVNPASPKVIRKIRAVGKLLGKNEDPNWGIPD